MNLLVYSGDRRLTDSMSGRDRWKKHTLRELVWAARHQLDLIELGGSGSRRELHLSAGPAELSYGLDLFARDHGTKET